MKYLLIFFYLVEHFSNEILENKNEYERNIFQLKTQIDDITEKKQTENDKKVNFIKTIFFDKTKFWKDLIVKKFS